MKCLKLQVYEIKFNFCSCVFFINIQVLLSYKKDSVTPVTFYKVLYTFYLSFLQKRSPSIAIECIEDIRRGMSLVHLCWWKSSKWKELFLHRFSVFSNIKSCINSIHRKIHHVSMYILGLQLRGHSEWHEIIQTSTEKRRSFLIW